jgi:hypothetical protein
LVRLPEQESNPLAQVIYVRETFQVVLACLNQNCNNCTPDTSSELVVFETNDLPGHRLVKLGAEESNFVINPSHDDVSRACSKDKDISEKEADENATSGEYIKEWCENTNNEKKMDESQICDKNVNDAMNQTDESKVSEKVNKSVNVDLDTSVSDFSHEDHEDTRSVLTQASCSSSKIDKAINVDLSDAGISNIEGLLESLSRRVRDVERIDRDFARRNYLMDNDDSARAESVASHVSSTSSRRRETEHERVVYDGETHSLIRRQSVIIEGLTLESEELRKKCQVLEEELVTPVVKDINQKLEQVEGKLEETETYCYQVVEENVELKSEIETLESEISEVQDTFRDKDAKEFKNV